MSYTGGLALTFRQRRDRATEGALRAAAQVMVNGLKDPKPDGLRGGYTSGAFVTGNVLNSVFVTDVQRDLGGWSIAVATDVMYAVFWEFGHVNIFTRRYEREERWRPTMLRKADEAMDAYQRVYARVMS